MKQSKKTLLKIACVALLGLPGVFINGNTCYAQARQDRTVSGNVIDKDGLPLPGTYVVVTGTSNGTVTDGAGHFSIQVPPQGRSLSFSYIGYISQEVDIRDRNFVTVTLEEDAQSLDELIVIGYGTTTKRASSSAITTIKGDDLSQMRGMNLDAMLQGTGTGLQVTSSSGAPDAPVRVLVRGTGSIFSSAEPLWVIDGIPVDNPTEGFNDSNPLALINPNDIESIEVLKDAAATAIYGSRGSNGIILVTTKSGRKGTGRISFDYNFGVTELSRTASQMGYMNSQEWLQTINLSRKNAGLGDMTDSDLLNLDIFSQSRNKPGFQFTKNMITDTDWYNEIVRRGHFHEVNLSSSRGFDKGDIYFSTNYRTEESVLKNSDFNRFSIRSNANWEPVRNLKMGFKVNLGFTSVNKAPTGGAPSGNLQSANGGFDSIGAEALNIVPIYDAAGDYFNILSGYNLTATSDKALQKDYRENYKVIASTYAEYKLPFVEGLSLRAEAAADITHGIRNYYIERNLRPADINYVQANYTTRRNINTNFLVNYNRYFGDIHHVNAVAGVESQRFTGRSAYMFGQGKTGVNMDFGSPTVVDRYPGSSFGGERYILSYFGRVNYMLKNRYLVGASYRRDGVSIFREQNRWAGFFAASLGWILSEEDFLKDADKIELLKLRTSFGQTGNQSINANATYTTKLDWPGYGELGKTVNINTLGSSDLTWETTDNFDIGLDFGFFKNRINGSVGYYLQNIRDMLYQVPVSYATGLFNAPNVWANVGDMRNQGLEFNVNFVPVSTRDFQWKVGLNLTTNHSKVIKLSDALDDKGLNNDFTYIRAGERLATFFLAEFAGIDDETGIPMIYQIDRDVFNATGETVKTGNLIPATTDNINKHKILHKDKTALPTLFGGFNTSVAYKGFELSLFFSYQAGNYIFWNTEFNNVSAGNGKYVLSKDLLGNTWTGPGSNAKYPILLWNNKSNIDNNGVAQFKADGTPNYNYAYQTQNTDFHLYKGDYLRLRSAQLSYTIPSSLCNRLKLSGMRLYVSGNNLFTITGFKGWDVERAEISDDAKARNIGQGKYGNFLPSSRIWNVGASINF